MQLDHWHLHRRLHDRQFQARNFAFVHAEMNLAAIVQEFGVFDPIADAIHIQMLEGISEDVAVERVRILRQAAVFGGGQGAGRTAIDGFAVPAHPFFIYAQGGFGARIQFAHGGRSHIHQQVAASRHCIGQHADELSRALPGHFIAVIAPAATEGLAGLPDDWLAIDMHPAARLHLFWRIDIGGAGQVEAVVDDDIGLQAAA